MTLHDPTLMNYPAASGRSINPKKQKQDTPQAAGELTQKRLKGEPLPKGYSFYSIAL